MGISGCVNGRASRSAPALTGRDVTYGVGISGCVNGKASRSAHAET